MISFIVIGFNEAPYLRKCFNSIYNAVSVNAIEDYEIIYVDSNSTDKSIDIAKEFEKVKIFEAFGACNAAVGRNIGAKEATGQYLFFIDGDMEINADFVAHVMDEKGNVSYKIVSGQILDIVNGTTSPRSSISLGGIFIIQREIWESAKGMRTKYRKGQDMDLGLRLAKEGIPLIRRPEIITNHYTVPGMEKARIWSMVWNRSSFYARCVLYRDHLFNKHMYNLLWKNDKTTVLLFIMIIASIIFPAGILYFGLTYFTGIFFRSIRHMKYIPLAECLVYYLVWDFLNIVFFFTFFPKNKDLQYRSL